MADDHGYEQEFIDFAADARKNLAKLINAFEQMAAEPLPGLPVEDRKHLAEIADVLDFDLRELLSATETVSRPIDQLDIVQSTLNLLETAFWIGRHTSLSFKSIGSKGGKASAQTRQKKMEKWQSHCMRSAQRMRESNPSLKIDLITERIISDSWPVDIDPRPGWTSIRQYIAQLDRKGLIGGAIKRNEALH